MPGFGQAFLFNQYMKKEKPPHRGRFQAQGDNLQKGSSWTKMTPQTKSGGKGSLNELEKKLSRSEFIVREQCFEQALKFIERTPGIGIEAFFKKPFYPCPPKRDIRVDLDILAGTAFIDD